MLRVSVDVSAVPADPAGAGRYTVNLVAALGRRSDLELVLLARRGDARWTGLAAGAQLLDVVPPARPARLAWEQGRMPRLLRALAPDVHHGPHYTMPERSRVASTVTVHDLTFFDHPEWHERSKVLLFRRAIRVAARRARVVVCVSRHTAEQLHRFAPPRAEVRVVAHGVDHARFRPGRDGDAGDLAVLAGVGVRPPFVAFVGTPQPRKGIDVLIRAFDRMCASHPQLRLVLAGGHGWGGGAIQAALAAMANPDRVVRTGYLPDAALPALLRQAAAVAYPALAEGFGLPALEALACGGRLVTTSGTAMEEVTGDAAVLVPPGDAGALAEALDAVVRGDPGLPVRRRRGVEIAAAYTWEACAAGHVAAYRAAAGLPDSSPVG